MIMTHGGRPTRDGPGRSHPAPLTRYGSERLNSSSRGLLSTDNSRIETPTFGQTWELDQTGNWDRFTEFDDQGAAFSGPRSVALAERS
jgi:hypothetical protein